jgi:alkanesulfonate monooxygenase SsuD/methylene tetrahydromethanopterin reductase-like flavin-dependent oxidoreductase (luciferase family)
VNLDEVALVWPPVQPAPIFVGAVGPRTMRLSGTDADGTVLTGGTSAEQVRQARALIGDATPVVVYLHAATGPDAAERLEAERERWGYDSMAGLGIAGDAETVAEGVRQWAQAGADTVVLQPTPDDPDPEGFMRFVAQDVRRAL